MAPLIPNVLDRARSTRGQSADAIHRLVVSVIRARAAAGTVVDVGCGTGALRRALADSALRYIGCDIERYPDFPSDDASSFVHSDLDRPPYPVPSGVADVVVAVETIEHLENPRAFVRELARMARPGGLVVVTTPNQLSWFSLAALVLEGHFNAFKRAPGLYPAHITALLETDLRRIADECGLRDVEIRYTGVGRIPLSARSWPSVWPFGGRRFSDNVLMSALAGGPAT